MINKRRFVKLVDLVLTLLIIVLQIGGMSFDIRQPYRFIASENSIVLGSTFQKPLGVVVFTVGNPAFTFNGEPKTFDTPPIIKNGRTLLPIRAVIESIGGGVSWSSKEKKVTVIFGDNTIELWIGKPQAKINGKGVPIDSSNPDVVPEIISGRTMVPFRFIGENLGFSVEWDENSKTVTITYDILTYNLNLSQTFSVSLVENPSTGFTWHWEIQDPSVISIESEKTIPLSNLIGTPLLHTWVIKGLKPGSTLITFKYFRDFEPDKIEKTVVYEVNVK